MIKEAIKYIVDELSSVNMREVHGVHYSDRQLHKLSAPVPTTDDVGTLRGFLDLVGQQDGLLSHVVVHGPTLVIAYAKRTKDSHRRDNLVRGATNGWRKEFEFGEWFDLENFLISLRSQFEATDDRDQLVQTLGNTTSEQNIQKEDDGFTQRVNVKAGIHLADSKTLPTILKLQPYRTFSEVDQPISEFIFRVKKGHGDSLQCALFESDGNAWKLQAMNDIQSYLIGKSINAPVYA